MRRSATVIALIVAMTIPQVALADHTNRPTVDKTRVVQEFDFDGQRLSDSPTIGWSRLKRTSSSLDAVVHVSDLTPGGVYTFWWIVVQEDGTFPDDIFVALGAGKVVGKSGKATVQMTAEAGDPGITGFMPDGVNEIPFDSLNNTRGSLVRVEIAYHGQAADAGDHLDTWLSDFWTGTACPPNTPNPAQPHCPVYYAATHLP